MQEQIKLISGWSSPGGSTQHHIKLTNLLNANGYDCTFYGPHDWHLDKCKAAKIQDCKITVYDTVISHFIQIGAKNLKKHILSCHETNLFPLKEISHKHYDLIHFVSNYQKKWHSVNHPSVVIPAIIDKIKWTNPNNGIAGVIGSIDEHKQPHISVQRALNDGYEKVKLFGIIVDPKYFKDYIYPYIQSGKVLFNNHEDDKTKMYNQVCAVYSSSKRECLPMIQGECLAAGIPFHGLESNLRDDSDYELDDNRILEKWKTILD
jgi:hypothetical protein